MYTHFDIGDTVYNPEYDIKGFITDIEIKHYNAMDNGKVFYIINGFFQVYSHSLSLTRKVLIEKIKKDFKVK